MVWVREVKRFTRSFAVTIRVMDWLDMFYLVYIVGAGIVAGLVIEILMDEFR